MLESEGTKEEREEEESLEIESTDEDSTDEPSAAEPSTDESAAADEAGDDSLFLDLPDEEYADEVADTADEAAVEDAGPAAGGAP